ncbi:SRPBCC family protein [Vibrio owensii]|uniref:Transcriptional regulator n=1 Tax=Vibrio owensii CAIM 1854 = LMG 25443 TaxID=1229493 RepID=A0A0C1W5Z8_9VIBR|nr:SRPBCC family protein [Vibrio owensii]KIF51832.1 transcriptional regulator [Vibrio owensii CAIM 1854 = LMG 25443]
MLSYQVNRSIEIEKTQSDIIEYLKDFTHWPEWSPWIIMEPECELTYSDEQGVVGSGYQWNGHRIGTGAMVLESTQEHRLDMELHFFRPFKSHAKVTFLVTPSQNGCTVEWLMQSRVPWFLFFLKSMFKSMIGMDYDRGLRMLKSQMETGQVLSQLTDVGSRKQNEINYIGLMGAGTIPELGTVMQDHVARLYEMAERESLPVTGELFCYYLSMDMKQGYFEFITCLPVKAGVAATGDFVAGTIPECETYVVEHKGEYWFLGNAWSFVMNLTRQNGIKVKTKPLGIERYLNNPNETEKADLLTEVIVFKK